MAFLGVVSKAAPALNESFASKTSAYESTGTPALGLRIFQTTENGFMHGLS